MVKINYFLLVSENNVELSFCLSFRIINFKLTATVAKELSFETLMQVIPKFDICLVKQRIWCFFDDKMTSFG